MEADGKAIARNISIASFWSHEHAKNLPASLAVCNV